MKLYPFAVFDAALDLFTICHSETCGFHFKAVSGLPAFAGRLHQWERGKGPLPQSEAIMGEYAISTEGYPSAKAKSTFFHITPDPVVSKDDPQYQRCELGVHADLPPEGKTNGCIGLVPADFALFCDLMGFLFNHGITTLPLTVFNRD